MTHHQRRRQRLVLRLLRGSRGRAIDYGCGYGDITAALSDTLDITGVDINSDRVNFARENYPRAHFQECRSDRVDFNSASFDIVVSSVVLHWVPDPDRHLAEAARLLRDGGQLVILLQNLPVINNAWRALRGQPPQPQVFWNESYGKLRGRLAAHGFVIEQVAGLYDAWREIVTTPKDLFIEVLRAPFRLLGVPHLAHYYGVRARLARAHSPGDPAPAGQDLADDIQAMIVELRGNIERLDSRKPHPSS